MLTPITIRYPFRPARRSLAAAHVADLFGLAAEEPPHVVAEGLTLAALAVIEAYRNSIPHEGVPGDEASS